MLSHKIMFQEPCLITFMTLHWMKRCEAGLIRRKKSRLLLFAKLYTLWYVWLPSLTLVGFGTELALHHCLSYLARVLITIIKLFSGNRDRILTMLFLCHAYLVQIAWAMFSSGYGRSCCERNGLWFVTWAPNACTELYTRKLRINANFACPLCSGTETYTHTYTCTCVLYVTIQAFYLLEM